MGISRRTPTVSANLPSLRFAAILTVFAGHAAWAGFEIADVTDAPKDHFRGFTRVYLDYGDNRITREEWETFVPPKGYLKNTPRNPEFNQEVTFSSPGLPAPEVEIDEIGKDAEGNPFTWKFIAQIQSAMWPYNRALFPNTTNAYQAAFATTTPPAGSIKFSSNEKNQEMVFFAREGDDPKGKRILRFFITDPWGNKFIMGAAGPENDADIPASFEASVLPKGWKKSTGYLKETISLFPAYGAGNQAHYNLFRESSDNTFFQFKWGKSGRSIAGHIRHMPIWGGATDDKIVGRRGDNNLIHGAGGNDTIVVRGRNDTIYGDDGIDTVVFDARSSHYRLIRRNSTGTKIVLRGFGRKKTLYDVEFLRFKNRKIAVRDLKR